MFDPHGHQARRRQCGGADSYLGNGAVCGCSYIIRIPGNTGVAALPNDFIRRMGTGCFIGIRRPGTNIADSIFNRQPGNQLGGRVIKIHGVNPIIYKRGRVIVRRIKERHLECLNINDIAKHGTVNGSTTGIIIYRICSPYTARGDGSIARLNS